MRRSAVAASLAALFVLLAARSWRSRPAPGAEPEMPKWMAGVDTLSPPKAFGLGHGPRPLS